MATFDTIQSMYPVIHPKPPLKIRYGLKRSTMILWILQEKLGSIVDLGFIKIHT